MKQAFKEILIMILIILGILLLSYIFKTTTPKTHGEDINIYREDRFVDYENIKYPENIEYLEWCLISNQCEVPTEYIDLINLNQRLIKSGRDSIW